MADIDGRKCMDLCLCCNKTGQNANTTTTLDTFLRSSYEVLTKFLRASQGQQELVVESSEL